MNCMNQSHGLHDVAASTSNNTSIHSLIQLKEAGHDTTQTANSSSRAACSKYIKEQLGTMSKAHDGHEKYDVLEGSCVLVAVNAAKMSRHALEWALTNIVQPGDHITLLALLPAGGRRLWSLALISGDCARRTVARRGPKLTGKPKDVEEEISDCCSCMMQELRSLCDSKKAKVSIKVVQAEGERGAIAMEADQIGASWVVLDKHVMKKEGKFCLEQLKCNVVTVKQSKSSKILRLNLKGSAASTAHDDPKLASTVSTNAETRCLINDDAGVIKENSECDYRSNQLGSLKRAGAISSRRAARLNSAASKRRANHRFNINAENVFKFYESAATSDESSDGEDAGAACAHLFSSESETDSTMAKDLQYIGTGCSNMQIGSDQEVSREYGYSDLDMLSSSCEMSGHRLFEHSGLLCTPATSASPSNELQASGFDPNIPISCQHLFTQGVGEMVDLFRDAWKPAPCIITCGSSKSKPNSASTTPKSDTLTLTGSSYPKPSRSPSPSNQLAPPVTSSNPHAPALPCSTRVSRSSSPSKSNSCTPSDAGAVKLSSPAACTNVFYSATTPSTTACTLSSRPHLIPGPGSSQPVPAMSSSCISKNLASRRHDFVRTSRQIAQLVENGNGSCSTSSTSTSSSANSRRISDKEVTTRELMQRFSEWDHQGSSKQKSSFSAASSSYGYRNDHAIEMELNDLERTSSVRRAMSMLGSGGVVRHPAPAGPPPLCSICQHKAPVFGKPPRRFSYAELELATGGFSKANFLAEGGFGSVHRGVLPDGQAVAVKQHKMASSQGDNEFCSEVEVLSCAQHRNVVMLIGYCIERCRRLLVYEFICNGSLDSHLYSGSDQDVLTWAARQKVAVGAARGLRYLHEECRVGCIIHRDMRPNNILLTHDYEPMVGDFGLARWQPDGDLGVQTRVIGTFGYLAPEYAQSGEVTEKADVYSFGVVLLELVTGRKAVDLARPKGQQCLTEWARPLLEEGANMRQLIDPRLREDEYGEYELFCALHAACLCIRRDPHLRPRMSQVLRILEGDVVIDTSGTSTSPSYFTEAKLAATHEQPAGSSYNGSRSGRISGEYNQRGDIGGGSVSPPLVSYSGSLLSRAGRKRLPPHQVQYSCGLAKLSSYPALSSNSHLSNPYSTKRLSFEES